MITVVFKPRHVLVMGNTYTIRDGLKKLGFRWYPEEKEWYRGPLKSEEELVSLVKLIRGSGEQMKVRFIPRRPARGVSIYTYRIGRHLYSSKRIMPILMGVR